MPYLVDGNNLLGLKPDFLLKDPGARRRLVQQLARFARKNRTAVTVVFDGEPGPDLPSADLALGDVRVQFAGRKMDADSRILQILDRAEDPAGFYVVTSDRSLQDKARFRRARVRSSVSFRRTLGQAGSSEADADRPLSPEDIADWEDWFSRRDT